MRKENKCVIVYVAADGREFQSARACNEYEMRTNTLGARDRRVKKLLAQMNSLKRGNRWDTLKRRQERLADAKAKLLEAARGKRRYAVQFATVMLKAADQFLKCHADYRDGRREFDELRAELKNIEPRFDRTKKGLAK